MTERQIHSKNLLAILGHELSEISESRVTSRSRRTSHQDASFHLPGGTKERAGAENDPKRYMKVRNF
jgi:hypothetical protein